MAGVFLFGNGLLWGQLLVENFDYTAGSLLHDSGWTVITSGEPNISIVTPGLEYSGYALSGNGNAAALQPDGEEVMKSFAPQDSGTVYVSFLISVSSATTVVSGNNVFYLGPEGTYILNKYWSANIRTNSSGQLSFGVGKLGSVAFTDYVYALNTTYLIVIAYEFITGDNNDIISIWIDPPLDGTIPAPDDGHTVSYEAAAFKEIVLTQWDSEPSFIIDGIQITTEWPFKNTVVSAGGKAVPETMHMAQNYPNPFNPRTTIAYELSQHKQVTLTVFSISGQRIKTLVDMPQGPGSFEVRWDGKDETGHQAASGQYLFQLRQGKEVLVRKGLLVQ